MLELDDLKSKFDKAFTGNQVTREKASNDITFYHITSWDDSILQGSDLSYKGDFNIMRKSGRQISADLRQNPVSINFEPSNTGRDDGAELLDGLYRTDEFTNSSIEAYNNCSNETIVCGYGAWELTTEYQTNSVGDENQKIVRKPVYEANNTCFFDPNAKLQDKSDAKYVAILVPYSEEGYLDLVKELTGEDNSTVSVADFKQPEHSYTFPWIAEGGQQKLIYVVRFYHREQVNDTIITLEDPLGQPIMLRKSDVEEVMDELIDEGYTIVDERKIKRWQVTLYIASGADILDSYPIAGQYLPVIPMYGERAFIEGEEHYEGMTRLAKDPQRLRNFMLSYLGDIVSRSPRPKPIFTPEQVQGFEYMYEDNGADNSFPYYLQNSVNKEGVPLVPPSMPALPEQTVPQALMMGLDQMRVAIEDVASANMPNDLTDTDLSGVAISKIQAKLDMQSIIYQENLKFSKVYDAKVYASMASDVYDAPREVTLTMPDGSRKIEEIMGSIVDEQTGELVMLNDLTNQEFEAYGDISPTYTTVKAETMDKLGTMAQMVSGTDPKLMTALLMKQMLLIDGVAMDDIREYARNELVKNGFSKPETDEEKQMMQELSQQPPPPDPNMVIAEAESKKGDAMMAEAQRKAQADQMNNQIKQGELMVKQFDGQTKRMAVQVDAKEAGMNNEFKRGDQMQRRVDSALKGEDMRANHQMKASQMMRAPAQLQ